MIYDYFASRGPGEAGKMRLKESLVIQRRKVLSPVLVEEQPLAPAEAEIQLLESSFAETAQADHGPTMCPCRTENQRHPGLHEAECYQQLKGAVPGVLHLVLGSPEEERYGATGGSPSKMI